MPAHKKTTSHLREKHKQRKKKRLIVFSVSIVVSVVLITSAFGFLMHRDFLRISNVEIRGNSVLSEEEIKNLAKDKISGYYLFGFIPKDNILFFPRNNIAEDLKQNHHIKSFKIKRLNFETISIDIKERKPEVLACQNGGHKKCFFADNLGYVYSEAPAFSENVYLKVYSETIEPVIGVYLTSSNQFENMMDFILALSNTEIFKSKPSKVSLINGIGAEIKFDSGMRIIFNLDQKSEELSKTLSTILSKESFSKYGEEGVELPSERILSIDYIDLRFGNKVYYKLTE